MCSIGYLGYMGVESAFNRSKVFAAFLDSSTGSEYSSQSKRSYVFDLRYALENNDTLDKVADYMKSPKNNYTFGHLVFVCDADTSKVLENNISSAPNSKREVRVESSALNDGIQWGIDSSLGCVNSFLIKGNLDNHSNAKDNTTRWQSLKTELKLKGDKVTPKEMEEILSYHNSSTNGYTDEGNLYNLATQQLIIFQPDSLALHIFFRPKDGNLTNTPLFKNVKITFDE